MPARRRRSNKLFFRERSVDSTFFEGDIAENPFASGSFRSEIAVFNRAVYEYAALQVGPFEQSLIKLAADEFSPEGGTEAQIGL